MAWREEKDGSLYISGWPAGIASSPQKGIADMRCVNISTEEGEVSVNYKRVQQTNNPVSGGSITIASGNTAVTYTGTQLKDGTWIQATAVPSTSGYTANNYYFVRHSSGNTYTLSASFNGAAISATNSGTITFNTLNMAAPVDYAVEQTSTFNQYLYYILDSSGIVWVSGAGGIPGVAGSLSSSTVWSAISPSGSSNGTAGTNTNGIAVMYGMTNSVISSTYMFAFSDGGIKYMANPGAGGSWTFWKSLNWTGGYSHHAITGADGAVYFCDGPSVGAFYQTSAGTPFDPTNTATYSYTNPLYNLNPTDAATRLTMMPVGGSLGVIVGGMQNYLYVFANVFSSSSSLGAPLNIIWMPEAGTYFLLQCNNFVVIFAGNKGHIYLTTGSAVVPLLDVPDYLVSAESPYIQDPYFVWGGAMYLRGRIFFSIKDQTASHDGNCGAVFSFKPTFGMFPQEDRGASLRIEARSAYGTLGINAYDGYAPVIFAGQDTNAQLANGPQYVAAWDQSSGGIVSVDFSDTNPYTDGSAYIETDAMSVGTMYERKTYSQIEVKFASALGGSESITIYYRTDLGAAWASAGTVIYDTDRLAAVTNEVTMEKIQLLQLKIVMTAQTSSPSWVRIKEIYVR